MKASETIAVVGYACRYPDADSPWQLFENVLSKRQAFRNIPPERLAPEYFSRDRNDVDQIYTGKAALLKNYLFDKTRFRITEDNFNAADLVHWIALDVADELLSQFLPAHVLQEHKSRTGVIVGNTLTGEMSRANLLRLRWPYVEKILRSSLQTSGQQDSIDQIITVAKEKFKAAFPAMIEDSLAGGLSNTIAGRICNYFDLQGGGYTVDGACSSSLLAVCNACDAIIAGQLDMVLVGGVDVSLDPFELVGFCRAGALAKDTMKVYDSHSNGFLPGEGCGFVLLSRLDIARHNDLDVKALICGWGISSDGRGGLTRPKASGQYLALKRAYTRAGYGMDKVQYIEGHGTGTAFGDTTEIQSLTQAGGESGLTQAYLGSVKSNIGHTKAAAGMAGLIKAIMVGEFRVIPPLTGCSDAHPLLKDSCFKLTNEPVLLKADETFRAGINSMGFGGINTHVTLQEYRHKDQKHVTATQLDGFFRASQDAELFLFSATTQESLVKKLLDVQKNLAAISIAELTDLSISLFYSDRNEKCRLAIVANSVEAFTAKVTEAIGIVASERSLELNVHQGIFYNGAITPINIGLLFPGQGSMTLQSQSWLSRRLPQLAAFTEHLGLDKFLGRDLKCTAVAQPAIVGTSIAAFSLLKEMGMTSSAVIGHSVGEIAAMHAADIISSGVAMRIAEERGKLMDSNLQIKGRMLSVRLGKDSPLLKKIITSHCLDIACFNGTEQLVLSGDVKSIELAQDDLKRQRIPAVLLNVENAFHSRHVEVLKPEFQKIVGQVAFNHPSRRIYSTVTGKQIMHAGEVAEAMLDQLTRPVQFYQAFLNATGIDAWIEPGAGRTMQGMVGSFNPVPVVSMCFDGNTIHGLLEAAALLYASQPTFSPRILFENRFHRKFSITDKPVFICNPCEAIQEQNDLPVCRDEHHADLSIARDVEPLSVRFMQTLANKLGFPIEEIKPERRMLDDFHLNSLFVGHLLSDFALEHQCKLTGVPTEYANASVAEIMDMLEGGADVDIPSGLSASIHGISGWVAPFEIDLVEQKLGANSVAHAPGGDWQVYGSLVNSNSFLKDLQGSGIIYFLKGLEEDGLLSLLADVPKLVSDLNAGSNLVFVQSRQVASAFAKSLFLELKEINVLVINFEDEYAEQLIVSEIAALKGFVEVFYNNETRYVPQLAPVLRKKMKESPVRPGQVIVVTGGGKGITFECAKQLASVYQTTLLILGRTPEDEDRELSRNLAFLKEVGVHAVHFPLDITKEDHVERFVSGIAGKFQISGVIHGAGVNKPRSVTELTAEGFKIALNPKLIGLRNLLSKIDTTELRWVVSFGSLIAETGMEGNAEYALANEWMKNEMEKLAGRLKNINFLNIGWSVWSGTGMGEKLGALERLIRKGIEPITIDAGVKFFMEQLRNWPHSTSIIASGRFGETTTLRGKSYQSRECHRFIDQVIVHYPGIELISDCTISTHSDPYLNDHVVDGRMIFPGVMAIEAIAQAYQVLTGNIPDNIVIRNISFNHPIVLRAGEEKKIRIAGQWIGNNEYLFAIRTSDDAYATDFFTASIAAGNGTIKHHELSLPADRPALDPEADIYRSILFHGGSFQSVSGYEQLSWNSCICSLKAAEGRFFSDFFPQELSLEHPSVRDGALHCVQACVPDFLLLPVSIKSIAVFPALKEELVSIQAIERSHHASSYVYDITMINSRNEIVEEYSGVEFKSVRPLEGKVLAKPLVMNVINRRAAELLGTERTPLIEFDNFEPDVFRRLDGRPMLKSGKYYSRSYSSGNSVSIMADDVVSCDMERITARERGSWELLLGGRTGMLKRISEAMNEDFDAAASRIWSAMECIRKSGLTLFSQLSIGAKDSPAIIYFNCGEHRIISYKCKLAEPAQEYILSVLIPAYEKL